MSDTTHRRPTGQSSTAHMRFADAAERDEYFDELAEARRALDAQELKRRYRELDAEHERLKATHPPVDGVEREAVTRVRNAKERIARELFAMEGGL